MFLNFFLKIFYLLAIIHTILLKGSTTKGDKKGNKHKGFKDINSKPFFKTFFTDEIVVG